MFGAQILAFFVVLFSTHNLIAQDEDKNLPDNSKTDFKEGFYFSIDMVLANDPIPPSWIESENETYNKAFYTDQFKVQNMVYFDHQGIRQTVESDDIWGFSIGGVLYVKIGHHFQEIRYIGCISYFIAPETIFTGHRPWRVDALLVKNKAYLIDFTANNVSEFDIKGLERILVNDPILWTEFDGLSRRKKKLQKFIYLKRYNERNPCN
jgi:hypothetical protein